MTGFLLARPDSVVRASGVRNAFHDPWQAVDALHAGTAAITGALPFDPRRPAALIEPTGFSHTAGPWRPAALPALPRIRVVSEHPSPDEHRERVARLIGILADPRQPLRKVVAARSVLATADTALDPQILAAHLLTRHPHANVFAVDSTSAGNTGAVLVGASPETLVQRTGTSVAVYPLAGTLPRLPDPEADNAQAQRLAASTKNQAEHAFVVDWIIERLNPVCARISVPPRAQLVSTRDVWHLGTPVHGVLRDPAPTALELALLLHPTPAVCGTPTAQALEYITTHEEDRGFYGGAVGWCDSSGDGCWVVAIRSAQLSADRLTLRAWAGGGIVAASQPQAELDETTSKLHTLLDALDIPVGRE
ncbi:isochorismate synthase [Nocardia speluncae]|uniref:isochorismate synthase n=1 Tax=Nocardia speluncae TaxID=419477 RepID=A0A846XSB6_9NOCA|nr:isochorismate synthase [Nocardia speluncae]NKY37646.1 isochorismate synthase [Nocardia speluncae]